MEARINYKHCPLCESRDFRASETADCSKHPLYDPVIPKHMQWMECDACKHNFIDGYFSDEALEIIFKKTHENQRVGYKIEEQRKVSAKIIEKVLPYKSAGTWLDIGFGNGSLIFTAEEYGFEPIGLDLRSDNVNKMRELGYAAHCGLIQDISFESKLSVVTMMDVLEHIPYPKEMLVYLSNLMENGGCLVLSMPNIENLIWKLMIKQNVNPYLGELEHYHNFSRTRLFSLLEECGFEAQRYGVSERYRVCMEVIATKR